MVTVFSQLINLLPFLIRPGYVRHILLAYFAAITRFK